MKRAYILFIAAASVLLLYSYGFIDPHLSFSSHPLYVWAQNIVVSLVYRQSVVAAVLYVCIIAALFAGYGMLLWGQKEKKLMSVPRWVFALVIMFVLSYPAFSYDIYNYIATAKVAFLYRENPYVVMPVEIPNEPMLSYTRAANKLALYGPAWIVLTSFPFIAGMGNIFLTVMSFKAFAAVFYAAVTFLIYRKTKDLKQALFFALNPLVLIEVLVSGHNDVVMMALGLAGLLLWNRQDARYKVAGIILFMSSVLIKGATIVLLPLFFLPASPTGGPASPTGGPASPTGGPASPTGGPASPTGGPAWKWEKKMRIAAFLMFGVFLVSPLREEMYPWYAVWWLSCLAFVPIRRKSPIHALSFWLSLGLMLRYVPWIATREYGGITPVSRIIVTVVPVLVYICIRFRKKILRPFTLLKRYL